MISDLGPILDRFLTLAGVTLAMVVGTDGLCIESAGGRDYDIDAVAAMATTGLGASQALAEEISRGRLVQAMIEFKKGLLLLEPLGDLGILLVLAHQPSSIGQVRLVARRERRALMDALET